MRAVDEGASAPDPPTELHGLLPGETFITALERKHVGVVVVAGAVAFYLAALGACFATLGAASEPLLPLERQAAQAAGAVLVVSVVSQLASGLLPSRRGTPRTMADVAMLATSAIAATSNLLMGTMDTPILVDPITGTSEYMVRWCEWTALAFLMTYVCEATSETDALAPLKFASVIGVSAGCGAVFPFCTNVWVWGAAMTLSFVLYFGLIPRTMQCRAAYRDAVKECTCPSHVTRIVAHKTSYDLALCCSVMWTLITLDYCVSWAAAVYQGEAYGTGAARPQWPFIADCVLDVAAKLLYARVIARAHEHVPRESQRQQVRWIREAMDTVWAGAQDAVILSEMRHGGRSARTIASKGLARLVGPDVADCWSAWHAHPLESSAAPRDGSADAAGRDEPTPMSTPDGVSRLSSSQQSHSSSPACASRFSPSTSPSPLHRFHSAGSKPGYALSSLNAVSELSETASVASMGGAAALLPPSKQSVHAALEQLVVDAWAVATAEGHTFTVSVLPTARAWAPSISEEAEGGGRGAEPSQDLSYWEVQATRCEREVEGAIASRRAVFLVLVVRDITQRMRTLDLETRLAAEIAEKQVLAEANRFMRHEVKNGVLAAIAQCEALVEFHVRTEERFEREVASPHPLEEGLATLGSELQRTLNTVLAAAMSKELANGEYVPRPEEVDVGALLQNTLAAGKERFELHVAPSPLPRVVIDPQLLFCVHRNAISNAVKYGCKSSPIETHASVARGTLRLRVLNRPGANHAQLLALQEPEAVFERGRRLHSASAAEQRDHFYDKVSAGDGGWIMRQCARALGGECSIRFERDASVFELKCPVGVGAAGAADGADGAAGEAACAEGAAPFQLPPDTLCIGIDDSKMQRVILKKMFAVLGGSAELTHVFGGTDDEIVRVCEIVLGLVRAHAGRRVFVIGDENLDLTDGCACTTVSCSAAFDELQAQLRPDELARTLLVIRSANDSRADVERYMRSAHAVLPKRGFAKHTTISAVAPVWARRFGGAGAGAAVTAAHAEPVEPSPFSPGPFSPGPRAAACAPDAAGAAPDAAGAPSRSQPVWRASNATAAGEVLDEIARDVRDVVRALSKEVSSGTLPWAGVRRALITIKGELCSLSAVCGTGERQVSEVVRRVEQLLAYDENTPTFRVAWAQVLAAVDRALFAMAS